jgi:arylsulfatase B
MIANIDDNAGRLVKFLRDRNLERDTLLIFMTDNGSSSGAQVFNAGMRGQKGSPYEGGHRVPFFVSWPRGGLGQPRDIATLAAHIDVLPTLIDLLRLKRPAGLPLHGKSLRPLLFEDKPQWADRSVVVDSQRLENIARWRQAAVMTDQWRLVNPSPDGSESRLELYDIRLDPGQRSNIASQHPEVVARLKADYQKWWEQISPGASEPVRIVLGSDAENPSRLTCHDWHGGGADETWNQRGIRKAPAANGFWTVDIARAGEYRIELRRWPKEVDLPVNAAYADPRPNRETAPGRAINAVQARLKVASVDQRLPVQAGDKGIVFSVRLPAGAAELQTWFYDKDGAERGAYFVYAERLKL